MNLKKNLPKSKIIIVQSILSPIVFGFIIFNVFEGTALQSNIILIVILIVSAIYCLLGNVEEHFYKRYMRRTIFCFLFGFCLVGNYLFCFPLDKSVEILDILKYLLISASCWPFMVTGSSFWNTAFMRKHLLQRNIGISRRQSVIHFIVYCLIPLIIGIVSMVALNPCIVSYDAFEVIAEAKRLTPVQEYAGVLYVLWFRLLLTLIDSEVFLCIVQVIIYSLTIGFFLRSIENKYKLKFSVLLFLLILFSILPNNIMMLITLSKDVYYAVFLCILMMTMIKLGQGKQKPKDFILFAIALILVWSIRQSGIISVVSVVLLGILLIPKKKTFILTSILAIVISVLFNLGLVRATNAEPVPGGMKYIALYQDILGVYYSGGSVSEKTEILVAKGVGEKPEFKDKYTPYWAYYDYYYPELEGEQIPNFIKCYISTLIRNPVLTIRAILCRLDMMWNIHPGMAASESWQWRVENSGGNWTYLVKERKENFLTDIYNIVGEASKEYPSKDIIWRVAIWNILLIGLFAQLKNKQQIMPLLPFLGFIVAYAVSLGWSHYRYYWADELLAFLGCIYVVAIILEDKNKAENGTIR